MTLTELSTFITSKLSDTDTSSVAACKTYCNQAYRMAWDSALWVDTLGISTKAVSAGDTTITLDGVPSVTFYQSGSSPSTFIDLVVASKFTRTGDDEGVEAVASDFASFFALDPNAWIDTTSRRGNPANYIPLPRDASGYMRIKPVPVPDVAGTQYVLGKLKWVALTDNDSPALRGADNFILAMAEGFMLERARQRAAAQLKFTEGAAHLALMRDIERGQQQIQSRIVPDDDGFYDPTGGPQ